jgi:hypothetical protein
MTKQKPKEKKPDMNSPFRLWTLKEVSEATNVSIRTLHSMIKQGDVVVKRIGTGRKSIRIPNDEVVKLARI